jgi:hypothetical protein
MRSGPQPLIIDKPSTVMTRVKSSAPVGGDEIERRAGHAAEPVTAGCHYQTVVHHR